MCDARRSGILYFCSSEKIPQFSDCYHRVRGEMERGGFQPTSRVFAEEAAPKAGFSLPESVETLVLPLRGGGRELICFFGDCAHMPIRNRSARCRGRGSSRNHIVPSWAEGSASTTMLQPAIVSVSVHTNRLCRC